MKPKEKEDDYAETSGSSSNSDNEEERKKERSKTKARQPRKSLHSAKSPKVPIKGVPKKKQGNTSKQDTSSRGIPQRYRPNRLALLEIKHYQSTTDLLLLRRPFARLVREITQTLNPYDLKYKPSALEALQMAAEYYLIGLFEDSYLLTVHRGRVTLNDKDILLAKRIRGGDH